jgi:hypothetical protein
MQQSTTWFVTLAAFLALAGTFSGCGSEDSTPAGGSGSGGTGGSGGGAGTAGGGAAGKGGSAGMGGTAGGGAAGKGGATMDSGAPDTGGTTISCGNRMCPSAEVPMIGTLEPCCPGGEMNACGLRGPNGICFTTSPGTPDPACPPITLMGATVPGCCTATAVCGGEVGAPLGCNDLSIFTGTPPMPCGPDAGPPSGRDGGPDSTTPPPDAGTDTGGGSDSRGGSDSGGDGPGSDGAGSDASSDARSGDSAG